MRTSLNVATPLATCALVVPERVAPAVGLVPIASRTLPPATRSPDSSVTVTWRAGEIAAFAHTPAGGWLVNARWAGARPGALGDQLGSPSNAGLFVSGVRPDPSPFMTYRSSLPSRLLLNAICRPSGDQLG